jgi:lipoprotein-releasing system permease protein
VKLSPTLYIAIRFFIESKRAMFLSAVGVIIGVAFFITGQAQTEGFQNYFIDTILGSKGALIISDRFRSSYINALEDGTHDLIDVDNPNDRKYYPGITDAYTLMRVIREMPNVEACAPVLQGSAKLRTGFRSDIATIFGIDLDLYLRATDFEQTLVKGELKDFQETPDAVVIGKLLADKLEIDRGQYIFLLDDAGISRRFKVTNIYETGVNAIDEERVYLHRRSAQIILNEPFETSFIQIKLKDPSRAPQDAVSLEGIFSHRSRSWQEREKSNLQIFNAIKISAGLALSCIILLAGFGIFNVLTLAVLEKTKEIAILKSMGYSRTDIASVFLWQGLFVAVLGILAGWALGAGLTYCMEFIPIKVRGIFKADHFIVAWKFTHYLLAAALAFISVMVASYIPAARAARMEPVRILRGSSS